MEKITIQAQEQHIGERIDRFVCEETQGDLSRSMVQKLCADGLILVNEKAADKNHRLRAGEQVVITLPPPKPLEVLPQDIPLNIVYEDDALLVVDKPKGLVVHPAVGNEDGTMVNALLHHCGNSLLGIGGVARPGIVHRIDKDTSGLLVVAKTDLAHQRLSLMVKQHSFTRLYHAVVYGNLKTEQGVVDAPIGRHPTLRKQMCVTNKNAREAVTHYTVHQRYQGFTHAILQLETGRTHQIRVHMRHIGHPIAGDPVYGPKKVLTELQGQCLHAETLGFTHPVSGEYKEFHSPLPQYFTRFLSKVKAI